MATDQLNFFIFETDTAVQQKLREQVSSCCASRKERIAVVAGGESEGVEALIDRAAGLNSERMVLVAPGAVSAEGAVLNGIRVAAAVAGAIALGIVLVSTAFRLWSAWQYSNRGIHGHH